MPSQLLTCSWRSPSGAGGGDLAEAQDVDAVRHGDHAADVVVDEEDAHALGSKEADPVEDLLDDLRRKPDRGLVDQAELRAHEPGLGELDHLLLTAREVAGLVAQLRPDRREAG